MKNPIAFFLAVMAIAMGVFALYTKAHAETAIKLVDGTSVFVLHCENATLDDMVVECRAALSKACPEGGKLNQLDASPEGVEPAWVDLAVQCKAPESGV